jgi:FtsP/CotA-like multicopper oxidase with cupredoxin domain
MRTHTHSLFRGFLAVLLLSLLMAGTASAKRYFLVADETTITMPNGETVTAWGFGIDQDDNFDTVDHEITVPGPVLEIPFNHANFILRVKNNLPERISLNIVGQRMTNNNGPIWDNGARGARTAGNYTSRIRSFAHECPPGAIRTYRWDGFKPGSFLVTSGTNPAKQIQMGLYAPVFKDAGGDGEAYPGVFYDRALNVVFSEVDSVIHAAVANGDYGPGRAISSSVHREPDYFLINGMAFPDMGLEPLNGASPLNLGETILLRFYNAGGKTHVPQLLGQYMTLVAEDGLPYQYPKEQYGFELAAGKTTDALAVFDQEGTTPLYDASLKLSNAGSAGGGMLAYLNAEAAPLLCEDLDGDGFPAGPDCTGEVDCDDNDATIYPGADEIADDGIDQDCDGSDLIVCVDNDGDGVSPVAGCDPVPDCDDNDATIYPGANEIADDGIDQDCDGADLVVCVDNDGDGVSPVAGCDPVPDCNDNDPTIYPGAAEIPDDGIDQDCDGGDLIVCVDNDNDGYFGAPDCTTALDCDDNDPSINPGAVDTPDDGIDQDCDGVDATTPPAAGINFNDYAILSYDPNQDDNPAVTIEDGGATLHIAGNGWKKIAFPYTVTPDTVLEFDFMTTIQSEIHGIGFDTDDTINNPIQVFQLYGSQNWGVNPGQTYDGSGTWMTFQIPVGTFSQFVGNAYTHLTFVNDHDGGAKNGESLFRNVQIYEAGAPAPTCTDADGDGFDTTADCGTLVDCDDTDPEIYPGAVEVPNDGVDQDCDGADLVTAAALNFDNFTILSYGGNQDQNPVVTVEDAGATLHIVGNGWKKIAFPYSVTANTVVEFDFRSGAEGEIHGIGFDTDDNISNPAQAFQVFGTQTWGIQPAQTYDGSGNWVHIRIPAGTFTAVTGQTFTHLTFVHDHDVTNPGGESLFRNVTVFEETVN